MLIISFALSGHPETQEGIQIVTFGDLFIKYHLCQPGTEDLTRPGLFKLPKQNWQEISHPKAGADFPGALGPGLEKVELHRSAQHSWCRKMKG